MHELVTVRQTPCEDPPSDTPFGNKVAKCGGMPRVRVGTVDSVAGTLLSVKTVWKDGAREGGRIRFRRYRCRLDVKWSGFPQLQRRSLKKTCQVLVADMNDCLLLVNCVLLFACCSDQDETAATVKNDLGSRYGPQFSQEHHGKTWSRTNSTFALSYAWLQERVDSGEIRTEKREGEHNTADIGTKAVSAPVLMKHLKTLRMEWRDGRHPSALNAAI